MANATSAALRSANPAAQPRFGLCRVGRCDVAGVQAPFGGRLDFTQHRNIGALRFHQCLVGEHIHIGRHGIEKDALADIAQALPART